MATWFEVISALAAAGATYRAGVVAEAAINEDRQIDTMARTIWGEARNQGLAGQQAVANVIMNRVKKGGWYGATPAEVCKKKYQFSCWLPSDPNYKKLIAVDESDRQFAQCVDVARKAINGAIGDNTGGATEYHTKAIKPNWDYSKLKKTASIGDHIFYKTIA